MKCIHCGHEWYYKGSAKYATCPSCMRKTIVLKVGEAQDQKVATKTEDE